MMVFVGFLTALLLATSAFSVARPSHAGRQTPSSKVGNTRSSVITNTSHVTYSSSSAGVILDYPSGTFYKVTGTFTVPTPGPPNGAVSVWVGIDGETCGTASLQTGIDMYYQNGAISYDSWYEWYPDYAYSFASPIAIRAGDVIRLTVTASSTTAGTALVENLTTGTSESQSMSYPSYPLCEANAEWIVENFSSGGLSSSCNFGTIVISGAYAYLNGGGYLTPCNGNVINMYQNGQALTSVSVLCPGNITIPYI